jgi:hypothetical protein
LSRQKTFYSSIFNLKFPSKLLFGAVDTYPEDLAHSKNILKVTSTEVTGAGAVEKLI